jgi:hypothetical protein
MVLVSANPTWVIEGTRVDSSYAGPPFERETDIRPASWAELKIKPTTRFV